MTATIKAAPLGDGADFTDSFSNETHAQKFTSRSRRKDAYSTPLRDFIWTFPGLSASERLVLVAMAEWANWNTGADIFPGTARICRMTNLARSTVIRARNRLIDAGAIELVQLSRPAKPARYRLSMPTSAMRPGSKVIPPPVAHGYQNGSDSDTPPGSTVRPKHSLPSIEPSQQQPHRSVSADVVVSQKDQINQMATDLAVAAAARGAIGDVNAYAAGIAKNWSASSVEQWQQLEAKRLGQIEDQRQAEYASSPEGVAEAKAEAERHATEAKRIAEEHQAATDACDLCDENSRFKNLEAVVCDHSGRKPTPTAEMAWTR